MTKYQATKALIKQAREFTRLSWIMLEIEESTYGLDEQAALLDKADYYERRARWSHLAAARVWYSK